ncbi:universal stress protein [Sulfobacillus thermosulfidooxidans]|uniref:universal stress protein n=1 Tax=Sulfobacillus thermosulfidooxidans TaxID=28034 RepID=UPI000421DE89|nr:universal stress protein [Sulfobacillus thermosulfidooxidans]
MERLVVAVNGSNASIQAVEIACQIVEREGQIICVDVEDRAEFYRDYALNAYGGALVLEPDNFHREWEQEAEQIHERIQKIAQTHHRTLRWIVVPLEPGKGSVAEAINEVALKEKADGIIVGRHRGTAFMEGLLGSVPRWLVTHSVLPVIVVPPPSNSSR